MAPQSERWQAGRKIGPAEAEGAVPGETTEREEAPSKKRLEDDAQPARAINEDDDGYDPYSDQHDRGQEPPLFEADPWR